MLVSNITVLSKNEAAEKQQLKSSVISGIETGKKGFQPPCAALLRMDEVNFNTGRLNNVGA